MYRLIFIISLLIFTGSISITKAQQPVKLKGDLVIFHAGSLAVPFREVAQAFMEEHPDVRVLTESAGSVTSARKITDLHRPCDIMASADYAVIDEMLIPQFADWNISFARNEMAIVYHDGSRYAEQISTHNWTEILVKPDVFFGRSDPNSDPCGYRSVMTIQLAARYYHLPSLPEQMLLKDLRFLRPKEVDLIALLESGNIDYIFLYKSVAIQHGLKFVTLPDEINLGNPKLAALYKTVSVDINGKKPGEKITIIGEPMVYGITMPGNAPNKPAAIEFLRFLLSPDKGMKVMESYGQPSVIPMENPYYSNIPEPLTKFCLPESGN